MLVSKQFPMYGQKYYQKIICMMFHRKKKERKESHTGVELHEGE